MPEVRGRLNAYEQPSSESDAPLELHGWGFGGLGVARKPEACKSSVPFVIYVSLDHVDGGSYVESGCVNALIRAGGGSDARRRVAHRYGSECDLACLVLRV